MHIIFIIGTLVLTSLVIASWIYFNKKIGLPPDIYILFVPEDSWILKIRYFFIFCEILIPIWMAINNVSWMQWASFSYCNYGGLLIFHITVAVIPYISNEKLRTNIGRFATVMYKGLTPNSFLVTFGFWFAIVPSVPKLVTYWDSYFVHGLNLFALMLELGYNNVEFSYEQAIYPMSFAAAWVLIFTFGCDCSLYWFIDTENAFGALVLPLFLGVIFVFHALTGYVKSRLRRAEAENMGGQTDITDQQQT